VRPPGRPSKQAKRHQQQAASGAGLEEADAGPLDPVQLTHLHRLLSGAAAADGGKTAGLRERVLELLASAAEACGGGRGSSSAGLWEQPAAPNPTDAALHEAPASAQDTAAAPAAAAGSSSVKPGADAGSGDAGGSAAAASEWEELEAAAELQRQLLGKRRQPGQSGGHDAPGAPETAQPAAAPAAGAPGATPLPVAVAGPAIGCWRRVAAWQACPIGCVPSPLLPGGVVPHLDPVTTQNSQTLAAQQPQEQAAYHQQQHPHEGHNVAAWDPAWPPETGHGGPPPPPDSSQPAGAGDPAAAAADVPPSPPRLSAAAAQLKAAVKPFW
jgi:hypothetical protein